jgi:hypothetical protein
MNNSFFLKPIVLFSLSIISGSCHKNNQENPTCISFIKAPVTKIEGPNVASVNQEITLTVSFGCYNGCGQFGNFDEVVTGSTASITINAKYEGCICTQDAPIREAIYKFKQSQKGKFDIKFLQTGNIFLTHTITVQ